MKKITWLDYLAFVLVIVGGLNWGLVGLFGFDLVKFLFGESFLTRTVFVLVGLSALYSVATLCKMVKMGEKSYLSHSSPKTTT